jgi:glycopeptide antibiotics resistance protein
MVGYLSKTPPEDFKLEYFLFTILISFIVAMGTTFLHWTYTDIQTWLANGFVTWYIWKGATIIAKILRKQTAIATNSAATGPGPPTTIPK